MGSSSADSINAGVSGGLAVAAHLCSLGSDFGGLLVAQDIHTAVAAMVATSCPSAVQGSAHSTLWGRAAAELLERAGGDGAEAEQSGLQVTLESLLSRSTTAAAAPAAAGDAAAVLSLRLRRLVAFEGSDVYQALLAAGRSVSSTTAAGSSL